MLASQPCRPLCPIVSPPARAEANPTRPATVCVYVRVFGGHLVAACANASPAHHGTRSITPQNILLMGDGFEVVWIDATRNATQVVKFKPLGNRTMRSFIEEEVGGNAPSISPSVSIAASLHRSLPNPAGRFVPSVFDNVLNWGLASMMPGKVSNRLVFRPEQSPMGVRRKRRRLTASAHTQTRRIGAGTDILWGHCSDSSHESGGAVAGGVSAPAGLFALPALYHEKPRLFAVSTDFGGADTPPARRCNP
jgi:hypothetical protein